MMPYQLPEKYDLAQLQVYVEEAETKRGFVHQGVSQKLLLLAEEVGELIKALRGECDMKRDQNATPGKIEDELADVIFMTCCVANRMKVDLATAIRNKEEKNKKRVCG